MQFITTIRKQYGTYQWVNRYFIDASALANTDTAVTGLVGFERAIHSTGVQFVAAHTRTPTIGDYLYRDLILTGTGLVSADVDRLPLTDVLKVEFQNAGGRPDYKLYRTAVNGSYFDNDFQWNDTYFNIIETAVTFWLNSLIASGEVRDSQGNPWQNAIPRREMKSHQKHRRRKKAVPTTP